MTETSKLYIHIGLHKTATSSFQRILKDTKNNEFMLNNKINCITELKDIKKDHINILSSEGWIMPEFNNLFMNDNRKERNIKYVHQEIETFLKSINYKLDIEIICVLREQSSYIESLYLQGVKTNIIKDNFNSFKKQLNIDKFNYLSFVNDIKKYYRVHCLWYEMFLIPDKTNNF